MVGLASSHVAKNARLNNNNEPGNGCVRCSSASKRRRMRTRAFRRPWARRRPTSRTRAAGRRAARRRVPCRDCGPAGAGGPGCRQSSRSSGASRPSPSCAASAGRRTSAACAPPSWTALRPVLSFFVPFHVNANSSRDSNRLALTSKNQPPHPLPPKKKRPLRKSNG